jgi:hypothetical protein
VFAIAFLLGAALTLQGVAAAPQSQNDPRLKLAVFAGKWKTEAALPDGKKITSDLDCEWSPQQNYLVCEQAVKLPDREQQQLTVYSYSAADHLYRYSTFADPGALPTSGTVEINGAVWTYHASLERNGKTMQIRTTNEFTSATTEELKVESSPDGVIWTTVLKGSAHKSSQ